MKFAHIEMLFLIWAVPALFLVYLYGMQRRRRILERFCRPQSLAILAPDARPARRRIRAFLILGSVLFLALALAGPQYGYRWQEIERRGVDLIIALDCSRSMLAQDLAPTRLDRARREVFDLLGMLQGDRVGLVAFAGTAFLQCPLTVDYEAFHLFLNTLTPDFLPVGGTDLSAAIETAMTAFDPQNSAEKALILITDGESTGNSPVEAAEAAAKDGIKIFCIGVGSAAGVPVPDAKGGLRKDRDGNIILTRLDEETLKKLTAITGGTYVRSVTGDMDLDTIYTTEIRGKMEQKTLSSGRKQIWEDRFQWFLGLAVLLLLMEIFWPVTRRAGASLLILAMLALPLPARAAGVQDSMRQGWAAYDKGEYEKALKHFIDAQLEKPDDPAIYYNIGNAYYRLGDYESARRNYQEAAKSPDKDLKQKAVYNLGNTDFRAARYPEAIENYKEALKIGPDEQARQNIQFVEKVIAEKKQQEEQQKNNPEPQKDQEKPSEEQKDGQSDPEKDKNQEKQEPKEEEKKEGSGKEEEKPQPGQEQKQGEQEPPPEPRPEKSAEEQAEAKETQAAPAGEKPGEKSEEQNQAARLLNRLQDKPGAALMPMYQKRQVEKDW